MLRKTLTILFLTLAIFFFVIWIGHIILQRMDYMITFSRLIPLNFGWFMFGLSGLSMYLCLMVYSEGLLIKFLLTGVAFMGLVIIAFSNLFGGITYTQEEDSGFVLIKKEESGFRMGQITIYQRINPFISQRVASCHTGSDISCTYEVIDDILYFHVCGTTSEASCDIRTYPLHVKP